jgi:hypothetical protein
VQPCQPLTGGNDERPRMPRVNTEKTDQGNQILTPDTKPLTATRQAEIERGKKQTPRQKPLDVGLFDTDARNQKEMDL